MHDFYVDRSRLHIDGADIACPACHQTYDTICEGFIGIPPSHYPQPEATKAAIAAGYDRLAGTETNGGEQRIGRRTILCSQTGDDLTAHLFRTQLAAQQQQERAA